MMVIEPVPSKDWAALVRTPDIGKKLYGLMVRAGFSEIDVQVITRPDTDGKLLPMIKNMAEYARGSGKAVARSPLSSWTRFSRARSRQICHVSNQPSSS